MSTTLREGGLYAFGFGLYFVAVQLGAFALASRRFSAVEFGVFALYYSAAVFATSAVSRALQHRLIRGFPAEHLPLPTRRLAWLFGKWTLAGLLLGGILAVAARVAGTLVGLPGPDEQPVFYALLALFPATHLAWDLTGTLLRSYRWMRVAGALHALYGLTLILLVWRAPSYAAFFGAFLIAAVLSTLVGIGWIRRHSAQRQRVREPISSPDPDPDSLLAYFSFGVATLSARYLDRFIVGAFIGAEAAGVYFAIGVAVSAAALPISLVLPAAHGFLAQSTRPTSVSPLGPRRTRLVFVAALGLSPLVSAVLAWGLVRVIYPEVALGAVVIPFLIFSLGRSWYSLRSFGSMLLTRFDSVRPITRWETASMIAAVPVISVSAASFGIPGALAASGLSLVLISLRGLGGFRLLWRDGATPTAEKAVEEAGCGRAQGSSGVEARNDDES